MSELTDVASREAPRVEPARLAIPSGELRVYGADREELAGLAIAEWIAAWESRQREQLAASEPGAPPSVSPNTP